MRTFKWVASLVSIALGLLLAGCDALAPESSDVIEASGVVESVEIAVASEINGRVVGVQANQGDPVKAGQVLLVLENELLDAQYDQAEAAWEAAKVNLTVMESNVSSAQAGIEAAQLGLEITRLQFEQVLQAVRLEELPARMNSWDGNPPDEFELPSWYFSDDENIRIAEQAVALSAQELEIEKANLEDALDEVTNADIRRVEERLASAQFSFQLAQDLIDREVERKGEEAISDYLQSLFDSAEAELDSAQAEYEAILSEQGAQDLLEARARLVVAEERHQLALARLYQLQTGEKSLEVLIADLAVRRAEALVAQAQAVFAQAEAGLTQAEKLVDQARANLDLVEVQMDKLTVYSSSDGVVLAKTVEVGELLQLGVTAMTLGKLDSLTITVYVPEETYGRINIGDRADVRVDSFPGIVFSAQVTRIADQAEYTPRNVQAEEDRRTTVFAIELSVLDDENKLKPGMPADVSFVE